MKLGAHVSTAGGLDKAIDRAVDIGCETIQIFASAPQAWAFKPAPEAQTRSFREKAQQAGIAPVFFHAIYLINLGTPNPVNLAKGIESLVNYMTLAKEVEAGGIIFHLGSHGGAGYDAIFKQTVRHGGSAGEVAGGALPHPGGHGGNGPAHIGADLKELGRLIKGVDPAFRGRLKVCLDTQHCFAAGYDISTKDGLDAMLGEFDQAIGLENLAAVHANDSKRPLGAGVGRHENIGQGYIGIEGFEHIIANPAFRDVPFFLEVPGFDNKGPDKENLAILKGIRARLTREA